MPGCREVVEPGRNGYLVPAKDSLALGEALERLINMPVEAQRMGQESRAIAMKNFTVERVVAETLSVYRELLAL